MCAVCVCNRPLANSIGEKKQRGGEAIIRSLCGNFSVETVKIAAHPVFISRFFL